MKPIINIDQCMGCGNCLNYCPKKLLYLSCDEELNARKVHYIKMRNTDECLGCGNCELMCTAGAIEVKNNRISGFNLINKKTIPPHSGCYLGSLSKALADVIMKLKLEKEVVIFKKETADVNINVETHDYNDENFFNDGLNYKLDNPNKVVILITSSSKELPVSRNYERYMNLTDENITFLNTLNWFETSPDFKGEVKGGSNMLEETASKGYASFVARGCVNSPKDMLVLESYIEKAINNQIEGKSFSMVEIVFPCFYRLCGRPQILMPYEKIDQVNRWFKQKVKINYSDGILREV